MIELAQKNDCTGCSACYAACAKGAISMMPDAEGFLHPIIDSAKCVNCGLCVKACPVLVRPAPRKPLAVFAAKANDDDLRMRSSSGGVFSLLARAVIADGGIVFGAGFDHNDWRVIHKSAENEEELDDLRGSKYVQSDMGETYRRVKIELTKNRKVLFSGTPCQVAGLKFFLGKEYDKLIMQEVICNSVPSPKIFSKWTEAEIRLVPHEKLKKIYFRDKEKGWHASTLKYCFTTTTTIRLINSVYYKLWQWGFSVRPCCIDCHFRNFKSGADLTIGDCWGIEKINPLFYDCKGVSVVLINSKKGESLWNRVKTLLQFCDVPLNEISQGNPCLYTSFSCFKNAEKSRKFFWEKINSDISVHQIGKKLTAEPLALRIRHALGKALRKMGLRK